MGMKRRFLTALSCLVGQCNYFWKEMLPALQYFPDGFFVGFLCFDLCEQKCTEFFQFCFRNILVFIGCLSFALYFPFLVSMLILNALLQHEEDSALAVAKH